MGKRFPRCPIFLVYPPILQRGINPKTEEFEVVGHPLCDAWGSAPADGFGRTLHLNLLLARILPEKRATVVAREAAK